MVLRQMMSKTILIIRKPDEFSRILATSGFEIINLPLIETKPLANLSDFEKRLDKVENYDGIFMTSQNAARIFTDKVREKNINFSGKVYVLGEKSFEILKDSNLNLVYSNLANTAQEMLKNIAPEDLRAKRFLFIRGDKSLRVVPDFLCGQAVIDETIVYETRGMKIGINKIKELREKIERKEITAACFFSPSAAESFLTQFGAKILHQTKIATIGKTTAEFFERRDWQVDFVSSKSNSENFADELIDYLKES